MRWFKRRKSIPGISCPRCGGPPATIRFDPGHIPMLLCKHCDIQYGCTVIDLEDLV